ncbi:carboxypeptidase regulatory-like domain-containing protein [Luteibacter pinisoli]|uniref:Carboxypeptidase regulatory-like domain-containing protein n=1 Tax=Luteibacter pinisoli TaxID=2589080 RepID=A0A4Y5ZAN5_9GAMM|nr:carboxypeptidase regulatory-like domain-containing protein [Luteibacter pinisoli]
MAVVLGASVKAQGTAGSVFGHGPAGGEVTVTSSTGAQRHATISSSGRYTISPVPTGVWTVALSTGGQAVDTRKNIPVTVGRGAQIDFACPNDQCAQAK